MLLAAPTDRRLSISKLALLNFSYDVSVRICADGKYHYKVIEPVPLGIEYHMVHTYCSSQRIHLQNVTDLETEILEKITLAIKSHYKF